MNTSVNPHATGSAYLEMGKMKILCTMYVIKQSKTTKSCDYSVQLYMHGQLQIINFVNVSQYPLDNNYVI